MRLTRWRDGLLLACNTRLPSYNELDEASKVCSTRHVAGLCQVTSKAPTEHCLQVCR